MTSGGLLGVWGKWVKHTKYMRINEKLGTLLTLLMEQSWHPESVTVSRKRMELVEIKNYLDEHYYTMMQKMSRDIEEDEDWGPTIFDESKEEELIDDV